ncbi:MAG TPA: hypothetical protein VMX38_08630 [Verrucomicrobiae bacterium]|nr:hypothetical protein [Verrucomicrobiae bacterium]
MERHIFQFMVFFLKAGFLHVGISAVMQESVLVGRFQQGHRGCHLIAVTPVSEIPKLRKLGRILRSKR